MKNPVNFILEKDSRHYIPFFHSKAANLPTMKGIILAGDIGGSKTGLSLYKVKDGGIWPLLEKNYATRQYSSFSEMFRNFMEDGLPHIDAMCLGVAGPVINGKVTGTNFLWEINDEEIKEEFNIPVVSIINDMEANAFGLALLEEAKFEEIKSGEGVSGNYALVSPGTGLGEAGLYYDRKSYHPFASEGGHCDFCVRNEFDEQFRQYLEKEYGHVSWERVLSGPGIVKIYEFLVDYKNITEPDWFTAKIQSEDKAAVITGCAAENSYEACIETMALFTRYLATECAQVALKFKATSGIFIGGGILPRIIGQLDKQLFIKHFLQMDRMNPLLEKIPVNAILHPGTAMYGAAYYAAVSMDN